MSSSFFSSVMEFLSTPSARRATRGLSGTIRMTMNTFNLWRKLGEFCASI